MLEIKKVFAATAAKPKEKVFFVCQHPTATGASDLLELKRTELRARANSLGISADTYNANVNGSIRSAIRHHVADLQLVETDLLVDKEDAKKVYEAVSTYPCRPAHQIHLRPLQARDIGTP